MKLAVMITKNTKNIIIKDTKWQKKSNFQIARETFYLKRVRQLHDAVKVTMGPRGQERVDPKKLWRPSITKDGVSVAKEIELSCPVANMGANSLKK